MSIVEKLAKERRARLAAEKLLEQKQRELFAANAQLSRHARSLSDQIVEQRHGLETAAQRARLLKDENALTLSQLELANTSADVARRRLWDALETISDGFAVFDSEMRLVSANGAYLGFFGAALDIEAGTEYDTILRALAESGHIDLEGGDAHDWRHEMTARLVREPIPERIIRMSDGRTVRLVDRRSDLGDLVSMSVDITETIRREAELEEARIRAEAANRAKSAFLANMSHEIRTPMNGVVGMAELLGETVLDDEQRLFAETIRSSGEALLTIINDVLDYSKIEAEKMRLYPEPFDLERSLHEVLQLLRPAARDKGVKLLVDFDLFLPTRYIGDRGRIRQILTNLIGNAVKFTAQGHVLVRVVGMQRAGDEYDLHLTVEDTGIGIAEEHVDHIFGEFNQVEDQANRKFEGTGLGLAITRQLVEMMGGRVWVDSELGRGSCFGFRLLLPVDEPHSSPHPPERPILLKRALIVDDVQINRMILERQLQTYGLSVTTCPTPADALAAAAMTRFDVILTDLEMPDMDGQGLALALRATGVEVPILLLSSLPDLVPEPGARFAAILQKPILRSELFRALQDLSYPGGEAELVPPEASAPEQQLGSLRKMRILAAEDNRTNQLVFRKMVAGYAIDLLFAKNGREAVDLWRSFRPDLIFMDISMPEMDGREAARAIRAIEAERSLPAVPIIALTAHAMDDDADAILAAGIDQFLTKPLKKAALAEKIAAFCPSSALPAIGDAA